MHELVGQRPHREPSRLSGPKVLLVIGGGIAAYKSCELVRLIRRGGGEVTCVLTEGGSQFVTPLALAALSENKVYTSLFDLKDEVEMGHIQLSRAADLVVVCPATADLLAKMAAGIADDLATTLILATDKPVLAVPAMNVKMWLHEATRRNVAWLREAGVDVMEPDEGPMACGEFGPGRLPDPEVVWAEIAARFGLVADCEGGLVEALEPEAEVDGGGRLSSLLSSLVPRTTALRQPSDGDDDLAAPLPPVEEDEHARTPDLSSPLMAKKGKARAAPPTDAAALNHTVLTGAGEQLPEALPDPLSGQPDFDIDPVHRPLYGRHVLVTAGPTHEPIDPVRYIANRSSGKQGFAIAAAAAALGARVTLIAGPVSLPTPSGVDRIDVESAREMAEAVKQTLPVDAAVMVAAVADWRSKDYAPEKMKKRGSAPPALLLTENPDILAQVASGKQRPKLLVGFAAETEDVVQNAIVKRKRKAADWIVANDVSGDVMGGDANTVHIVTSEGIEDLPPMAKNDVALALAERLAKALDRIDPRDE
ncbi:bifunctional phosphopantothenoylcysteine decarboxylase/phosphopantothenate synthase [Altererythrobacter sp. TH136]|uniref:bifunctional phosphopantothenoylcysteine decarboxylase/phosphopantothenate synthase n=1 Tax=Altererythrobacter sp. TH136 TaxID=2067415 RepID=UPI00143CC858|nr:bifunctional phosphopantothenoylcysteine decarboxylase/phosphopantothenate synthase [Altererythrobacter sp. TH136]